MPGSGLHIYNLKITLKPSSPSQLKEKYDNYSATSGSKMSVKPLLLTDYNQ